jgi:hypothetical protein
MTPTVKLRFVWRDGQIENNGGVVSQKAVRVLQQWWQAELTGEWRDVPLEPAAVPALQKKEWVGLTDKEVVMLAYQSQENECTAIRLAEAKLKEKNNGNG